MKFINKVLLRWRNYENSRVLSSIRSQDESSSRTRTLFWNYQAEYMWELRSLFRVIGLLHIIGLCSHTCITCSSALCSTLVCAAFRLVELLGPPTASLAYRCTVGVNRDPPVCSRCPGSMASVAERQPYVRWRRATISRRRGL